jgi:hypothetical protein
LKQNKTSFRLKWTKQEWMVSTPWSCGEKCSIALFHIGVRDLFWSALWAPSHGTKPTENIMWTKKNSVRKIIGWRLTTGVVLFKNGVVIMVPLFSAVCDGPLDYCTVGLTDAGNVRQWLYYLLSNYNHEKGHLIFEQDKIPWLWWNQYHGEKITS